MKSTTNNRTATRTEEPAMRAIVNTVLGSLIPCPLCPSLAKYADYKPEKCECCGGDLVVQHAKREADGKVFAHLYLRAR